MKKDRLPTQAYDMLLMSCMGGNRKWVKLMKKILFGLRFGFVWLKYEVAEECSFVGRLKQKMKDCFVQEWHATNECKNRDTWYSLFKQNFGLEKCLNILYVKKFKDVLVRFHFGIFFQF